MKKEKSKLDFEKYKKRLQEVFPTYTEKELREYFKYEEKYLLFLILYNYWILIRSFLVTFLTLIFVSHN